MIGLILFIPMLIILVSEIRREHRLSHSHGFYKPSKVNKKRSDISTYSSPNRMQPLVTMDVKKGVGR